MAKRSTIFHRFGDDDTDGEFGGVVDKYMTVRLENLPIGDPSLLAFCGYVETSWSGIPFMETLTYLIMVIKQTEPENTEWKSIISGENILRGQSRNRIKLSVRWLLNNHLNCKVFSFVRTGCCCPSKIKNLRQLLCKGEDFQCEDVLGWLDF